METFGRQSETTFQARLDNIPRRYFAMDDARFFHHYHVCMLPYGERIISINGGERQFFVVMVTFGRQSETSFLAQLDNMSRRYFAMDDARFFHHYHVCILPYGERTISINGGERHFFVVMETFGRQSETSFLAQLDNIPRRYFAMDDAMFFHHYHVCMLPYGERIISINGGERQFFVVMVTFGRQSETSFLAQLDNMLRRYFAMDDARFFHHYHVCILPYGERIISINGGERQFFVVMETFGRQSETTFLARWTSVNNTLCASVQRLTYKITWNGRSKFLLLSLRKRFILTETLYRIDAQPSRKMVEKAVF
ncbi:hypothetical protein IV203_031616 [Nitzschia inconspicua]|uniref:Uncharacterized protein n=1 Tax=Nitzschia inconspicua TaxID=303405 RepID=A0A9K3K687_9STRA|nr:hypothetical protein IV203_011163 [Nitzschia inconspicua]KAG7368873.1 hypothetical protein IV203_031616 [Nitzschia inconspicua]